MIHVRKLTHAVHTVLDSEAKLVMEGNKKVTESVLKIVMLCGMQGLARHGHRDDGINWEDCNGSSTNEGNFVEVVRF